jgi:hypothetical protein
MSRFRATLWLLLICAVPTLAVLAAPPSATITVTMPDGSTWRGTVAADAPATLPVQPPPAAAPTTLPAPATDPVVQPPPALPAVRLPPLKRMMADPAAAGRGEGFTLKGTNAIADVYLDGWEQNITYLGGGGSLTLTNVRSLHAFRADSSKRFQGQGLYFGNPADPATPPPRSQWPGPATIRGCIFGWNGYRTNDGNLNGYRHGVYGGHFAGALLIEDSIFVGNACAGVQVRAGATIRRCVFLDNGVSLLSVAGDVTLEDCTFYGGHRYAEVDGNGKVTGWTGDNGVDNYTHLTLRNCLFAGKPGQGAPAGTKGNYDTGCIVNSAKYKPNPDWSPDGGRITASGCTIAGWPGPAFAGDRKHDGSGFVVKASPVVFDYDPILAGVLGNTIGISDAAAQIAAAVRNFAK